jgi:hypothetical protein
MPPRSPPCDCLCGKGNGLSFSPLTMVAFAKALGTLQGAKLRLERDGPYLGQHIGMVSRRTFLRTDLADGVDADWVQATG